MKVHTVMQLQVSDVLGMIANQIQAQYNNKVTKVVPIYKTVDTGDDRFGQTVTSEKVLTHFEAHFEQEFKGSFGE